MTYLFTSTCLSTTNATTETLWCLGSSWLVTCEVVPPLCNSDHDGISLTVKWSSTPPPLENKNAAYGDMPKLTFRKPTIIIMIDETDWDFLLEATDISIAWELWEQKCIPKTTISSDRNLPWMNRSIKSRIRKRNSFYRNKSKENFKSIYVVNH